MALSEAEIKERKNAARRTEAHRTKDREKYATNAAIREANRAQCRNYYHRKKEDIAARMREYNQRPEVQVRLKQQRKEWYERKGKENGVKKCKDVELRYARELIVKSSKALVGVKIPLELKSHLYFFELPFGYAHQNNPSLSRMASIFGANSSI
jgi:hypothetical protein